tara:strand:+ start:521 stop:1552 length:1032 start_codon:yes stop_codon:yes gene_type:complete
MKKKNLFNKIDKKVLIESLEKEPFDRITISFYRYINIKYPIKFRDNLYKDWERLNIFGRVYISHEGINAQISIPKYHYQIFKEQLENKKEFKSIPIKHALQDGASFYKLTIKVRKELVAYGLSPNNYDMDKTGNHLSARDYNKAIEDPDSIVIDMRNYYESEIGRFDNAIIPNVETSKELLPEVKRLLQNKKDKKILLYCTGGIRCEKASSFLIKNGFKDVNQLEGGIIKYAHEIKRKGLQSKFKGKNFVFDNRLGERVTKDVLSCCHICGNKCDSHNDCKNDACHILFIQCEKCYHELGGCCSKDCYEFSLLPKNEQKKLRKNPEKIVSKTFFDSRIKPRLN